MARTLRIEVERVRKDSKITKVMRAACDALYDGYLRGDRRAFERFVTAADRDVEHMATKLYRRWEMPSSEEIADVKQEFYTEIVRILPKFDPRRALAADYLVWNAFARGKKYTNNARKPVDSRSVEERKRDPKGADRLPSRCATVASSYATEARVETQDEILDRLSRRADLGSELDPESIDEGREIVLTLRDYLTLDESKLFERLVEADGDAEEAARYILDRDPAFARAFGATQTKDIEIRIGRVQRKATALAHVLGLVTILEERLTLTMRDAIEDARAQIATDTEADEDGDGEEKQGNQRDQRSAGRGERDPASGRRARSEAHRKCA